LTPFNPARSKLTFLFVLLRLEVSRGELVELARELRVRIGGDNMS
jgi:hypothetical protein